MDEDWHELVSQAGYGMKLEKEVGVEKLLCPCYSFFCK
jgi:hypothetical protein